MVAIVVVEKTGNLKDVNVNSVEESELYKKAGFKSASGFELQTTWKVIIGKTTPYTIDMYAKTQGRAGQENKYEFPPPVDKVLYFGNCLLMNRGGFLRKSEWEQIYNHLYDGFEDLDDNEDSEDEDEMKDAKRTKNGYVKDGFVVDDDDEDDDEDDSEDEVVFTKSVKTSEEDDFYDFEEELEEEDYL